MVPGTEQNSPNPEPYIDIFLSMPCSSLPFPAASLFMIGRYESMSGSKKNKVVVIGAGRVGESVVYTLAMSRTASEIVMVDVAVDRAKGSALDINHGLAFHKQVTVRQGDYSDCADAKVIIVTAGLARKPGQTRLDLAKSNVAIARQIAKSIMEYADDPVIVVISNPVDVLTYVIQQETGLPKSRVIGSGTILDTARFRFMISEECDVDITDVNAYILGEHGDSQVPVWSRATIAGMPLLEYCDKNGIDIRPKMQNIAQETNKAGGTVISLKGATYLGIAMNTSRIVDAILEDEKAVLPVSHVLEGEILGIDDAAVSFPCVVDADGIKKILDMDYTQEEEKAIVASAQTLKAFTRDALNM